MRDNGIFALFWILFHTVRDAYGSRRAWQVSIAVSLVLLLPVLLLVGLVLLIVY